MGEPQQPRQPRKPPRAAAEEHAPWLPIQFGSHEALGRPSYDAADASAIQALFRGDASPEQQIRAIHWILEVAAGTFDLAFHPGGEEGKRDTDFHLGRQFVGHQIRKLNKLAISALLRRETQNA